MLSNSLRMWRAVPVYRGISVVPTCNYSNGRFRNENSWARNSFDETRKSPSEYDTRRLTRSWRGFSPKAREAIQSLVEDVREMGSYRVKFVQNGKLSDKHLVDIINKLDPSKDGIEVLPNREKHCIVRQISLTDMIKNYNDKLAKEVEQMLAEQGSRSALRAIEQRERADKKRGAAKVVNVKWSISPQDLKLQKMAEIMKRVKKGEKFQIFIQGQDLMRGRQSSEEEERMRQLELKKRVNIQETLHQLLEEEKVQVTETGNLEGLLVFNCSPPVVQHSVSVPEKAPAKKTKKKADKKQVKKPQKVEEEDLDALYSFKIVD